MLAPLSWLKDYVDIELTLEQLARLLTMAGLEVDSIHLVGLSAADTSADEQQSRHEFKITGLAWDPKTIVVAQINEVLPHPNADRLVLCKLVDGATAPDGTNEHTVLTGAPNLFPYKGQGRLEKPLKVAYAREGARIYDGHQPGQVLTTLKRAKIRGVESYSMVCSEKELGISEEHEGILFLDDDAPTGKPLVDYMGDAVYEISILPNMARNASMVGIAREIAALTGKPLRKPQPTLPAEGPAIKGQVSIQITNPELNPRFVFGMLRGASARPSPSWVQRRLRLAGMRPINSLVDATNYVMLELGEPLHAFDYDLLVKRAGGKAPTIITRTAAPGEKLTTLDDVERTLEDFNEVVADTAGSLSLAGVMGGQESEITPETANILLEGASWNFINIRRTVSSTRLNSEAAYRFARGVHPALAPEGVRLCLDRMAAWSGGQIAAGLVDEYPLKREDPVVSITAENVRRLLGVELSPRHIAELLERLEFECRVVGESVIARTPPFRMDIGEGLTGEADLIEEVARMYGYNNIPATRMSDSLPPQRGFPMLESEERLRDLLVALGLQEVITYRLTSPEREARALPLNTPTGEIPYVQLANPIAPERAYMRRNLMASVLEVLERNMRLSDSLAFYEIGPVFLPQPGEVLPAEPQHLAIAMSGLRLPSHWDRPVKENYDFYDLKGILEEALEGLHIADVSFTPADHPTFHPGKSAALVVGGRAVGVFGELHPQVKTRYEFGAAPVLGAELDLVNLFSAIPARFDALPVPAFPPVLEDIAVIVDEDLPAERIAAAIREAGGRLLIAVRLFDIFRSEQIGAGKKSMAYSLTYQAPDRTLTDTEATQIRQRVIRRLEQDLGAKLRA
jgi:phenylalanyl-tRNA synthetase beta chain